MRPLGMSPVWSVLGLRTAKVGTGDPHYVQKSLVWTKLDTAMTRLEGQEAKGKAKELMVSPADKPSCESRSAHPET